jgi:hypothetical protein
MARTEDRMADDPSAEDRSAKEMIAALEATYAGARLDDIGSFQRLTDPLAALRENLRETYQRSVADPVRAVIAKLKSGAALTPADVKLVEDFVVGDAEAYIRMENDFQSWVAELARLIKVLSEMKGRLVGDVVLDALGEVEDARRVLGDICNYLEEKERIARFKRTMAASMNRDRAEVLIEILKEQLESPLI